MLHIFLNKMKWKFGKKYVDLLKYVAFLLIFFDSIQSILLPTVQKHQFFGTQLYLWSNSHIHVSAVLKEAKLLYSWASGLFVVLYGKEPMDPLVIFPLPHISCNYQNIWYYVSMNKTFCKSSDTGPNKALLSWKSILYQEYVSITVKLNCFCFQNGMVQHS